MNLKQFEWLAQEAEYVDLIVIAGDLLQLGHSSDKAEQISQIRPLLKHIRDRCPLLLSSGNHDGDQLNHADEECAAWIETLKTELACSSDFENGKYRFTSCPWWNGPSTRKAMLDKIQGKQPAENVSWTWIHHAPPRGSKTAWTLKGDAGDPYLLKLIGRYQPDFVLCGHVHSAPFYADGAWSERVGKTWVFNPGKQIGDVPSHIQIDLAQQNARYSSLEGIEILDLSG